MLANSPRHQVVTRHVRSLLVVLICTALSGCLLPEQRGSIAQRAAKLGFEARLLTASDFELFVLHRGLDTEAPLRIYIEGDGLAYRTRSRPSKNPTPRNPVALKLAMADSSAAVMYVARPCQYLTTEERESCSLRYWTIQRYSEEVVSSINEAIDWAVQQRPGDHGIGLVGFSGGGAVGALVGSRRQDVRWLVTLAANLDLDTWTRLLDLSPMVHSLNPLHHVAGLAGVPQLHLAGAKDERVPTAVIQNFADAMTEVTTDAPALVEELPTFDHDCCWTDIWPARLETFIETLP